MNARYCYRCGREFRRGEGYHLQYIPLTNKLVPVCRDDRLCQWQRPGKAAKEVIEYSRHEGQEKDREEQA